MSDPTQGAGTGVDLSAFDRVRPAIAPVVGFLVSLVCGALVARYGERYRFESVPMEVQVSVTVAIVTAFQYLFAEIAKLITAAKVNPSQSASPTFAKAAKASPVGSASEGVQNLAALAATGERPTAGAAVEARGLMAARPAVVPHGGYHTTQDAGTQDDDGEPL